MNPLSAESLANYWSGTEVTLDGLCRGLGCWAEGLVHVRADDDLEQPHPRTDVALGQHPVAVREQRV